MFNRIILIGNLTKDPDVRYTPTGMPVTTLRLAVTTKSKQGDEFKDETLFIDSVVFGKQAEACGQYLNKGSPVLVEGRLRERSWETDGQKKYRMEIFTNTVKFLPKKESALSAQTGADRQASTPSPNKNIGDEAPPEEITGLEPF